MRNEHPLTKEDIDFLHGFASRYPTTSSRGMLIKLLGDELAIWDAIANPDLTATSQRQSLLTLGHLFRIIPKSEYRHDDCHLESIYHRHLQHLQFSTMCAGVESEIRGCGNLIFRFVPYSFSLLLGKVAAYSATQGNWNRVNGGGHGRYHMKFNKVPKQRGLYGRNMSLLNDYYVTFVRVLQHYNSFMRSYSDSPVDLNGSILAPLLTYASGFYDSQIPHTDLGNKNHWSKNEIQSNTRSHGFPFHKEPLHDAIYPLVCIISFHGSTSLEVAPFSWGCADLARASATLQPIQLEEGNAIVMSGMTVHNGGSHDHVCWRGHLYLLPRGMKMDPNYTDPCDLMEGLSLDDFNGRNKNKPSRSSSKSVPMARKLTKRSKLSRGKGKNPVKNSNSQNKKNKNLK